MSVVNTNMFQKFKNARKLPLRQDGDGHIIAVEIREDEEQSVKLEEIIDLLVAAGYFRARIKGLSPFDKVVGGMTWCIETCNMDVDVDLLFQENSTIGQKISLTEKIVALLPKMKCPHSIEPHQIQGMDFIHVFPVIQWLVKRSMEFREENSVFVRAYALNQFNKLFRTKNKQADVQKQVLRNINVVNEIYRTHRYFKRKNAPPPEIQSRIQITLMEYGDNLQNHSSNGESTSKNQQPEELFLSNLTVTNDELVEHDLNEEEKKSLAQHYALLQLELRDGGAKVQEKTEIIALQNQKELLAINCKQLEENQASTEEAVSRTKAELEEIRIKQKEAEGMLRELEENEKKTSSIKEIEELVVLNDSLNSQEIQFKEHCRQELVRLQNLIKETKQVKRPEGKSQIEINDNVERVAEDVRVLRLKLAKKNRAVAALQRQLDEVPNRAELAQYQRRFLELYNQVAAKHKETKQYYTLYNTLEDTRMYMKKELSLLNSISENYPEAMQSHFSKDEFLKQFQNIVEGVRQSKLKVERKLMEEKKKRDDLSYTLQGFVENQRKYVNTVSQLSLECKKHESLLAKVKHNL